MKKTALILCFMVPVILMAQADPDNAVSLDDALKKMTADNKSFAVGLKHGTMRTLLYSPKDKDDQRPHDQDEVYIVVSGSGIFQNGDKKYSFKTNDVLFVPAKQEHRFIEFTDDFKTWVVFYGPSGGEAR